MGFFQGTNSDGDLNGTNQIYTFTSADAEQEFEKNGLKLSGDSSQNSYVIFYYLSETDYSQMIPTPTPAKATNVNPVKTPSLTMTSVSAYGRVQHYRHPQRPIRSPRMGQPTSLGHQ